MIKRLAIASLIIASPAFGQSVDPLIGTWKLNVEKSTQVGGQQVKSATQTWTGEGQNFTNTAEGVDAQGRAVKGVFRHIYDGIPHPTTGSPDYDSTTYTRVGNTINAVRFRQGKTVEVGQIVFVPRQDLFGYCRRYRRKRSAISLRSCF